jgi:phage terminase large subunit-like protein
MAVERRYASDKIPAKWRKLLSFTPGYDAIATAADAWFEPAAAQHIIDFYGKVLTHVKGEKAKAKESFTLEPWEQAIVTNMFGWKRRNEKGRTVRRYRVVFIYVPRKNGKTPLVAGLLLYLLLCDGEAGAEIYGAAADYGQARLVFEHARGMVMQSDELTERCKIYDGQAKAITTLDGLSAYRVISADAFTKHGYNAHAFVVDELHTQPNADLVDTLSTSQGARAQPLAIYITTADYERTGSICNELHDHARRVRDGVIVEPTFLPVIYETLPGEDWHNRKIWARVNPNLGVSITREFLEAEHQKAIENPRFETAFRRLYLNTRTQQDIRWIPLSEWDANAGSTSPEELLHADCYAGLDLGSTQDLTAFVLLFGNEQDGFDVLPWFWVPEDNIEEREKRYRVTYRAWINQGYIEMTPGNVTDYAFIRNRINEIAGDHAIRQIGIDRLFQGAQLSSDLMADGFDVVSVGMGFTSLTAPTKALERLILGHRLRHGGNPILRWMFDNCHIEVDSAGNIKPSKKKSRAPIDGIVSIIMAISRATANAADSGGYGSGETLKTAGEPLDGN